MIEKTLMPKIENQLFECERAITSINYIIELWPEKSTVVFTIKCWTNIIIYLYNMLSIRDSLKEMAFINETEEQKSLFIFLI